MVPGPPPPSGREIDSQAKALIAARAALEKQAESVVVMDLRSLSTVTDFFVVCTAGSARQLSALKDHIEAALCQHGGRVAHTEGEVSPSAVARGLNDPPLWLLMDCVDIVVHLLDQRTRECYRLEELWADAPRVPVSGEPEPEAPEARDAGSAPLGRPP